MTFYFLADTNTLYYKGAAGYACFPYVRSSDPLPGMDIGDHYLNNPVDYLHHVGINNLHMFSKLATIAPSVVAHELGHQFGLGHVFELPAHYNDYCDDTGYYDRDWYQNEYLPTVSSGADRQKRYDPNTDTWFISDNIMDYGDSSKQNTFTRDQTKRMHHIIKYGILVPTMYQDDDFAPTRTDFPKPPIRISD